MKYEYGESILKGSEGGYVGASSLFKGFNKDIPKKYIGKIKFMVGYSPYMGHISIQIQAHTLEAFVWAIKHVRNWGFFDNEPISYYIRDAKRN